VSTNREFIMSSNKESAAQFFEACETGKGWEGCSEFCHADASFTAQAGALAGVETLEAYTEWTKGLFGPIPDAAYELKSFAEDEERGNVSAFAVFRGTQTGEGGPGAATGNSVETDYVYVMQFDGGKIRHMTKIWNDGHALQQLGWA
jgi:ketosteroid isomerase-like protein